MERRFRVTVNGREFDVTVEDLSATPSSILPQPGDMKVPAPEPAAPRRSTPAKEQNSDPSNLSSPLAGLVVELHVADGAQVDSGQTLLVIEAMKMKTSVVAHRSGRVSGVNVKAGDAVDAGQILMSID